MGFLFLVDCAGMGGWGIQCGWGGVGWGAGWLGEGGDNKRGGDAPLDPTK